MNYTIIIRSERKPPRSVEPPMARHSRTQKQRGSRRMTRKASTWAQAVTKVYRQMKRENSNVSLKDAMVQASKLRKEGRL